jgi:hypothetical protein
MYRTRYQDASIKWDSSGARLFKREMNALNETQDKNVIKIEPYKRIEFNHNIFEKGKVTSDKRTKLENK